MNDGKARSGIVMEEQLIGGCRCNVIERIEDKFKLVLDFDDVITRTGDSKVRACKELFGSDISACLLDSAKLEEAGLTEGQYREIQAAVYKGTCGNVLIPMEGSINGLNRMRALGINPCVLTARKEESELESVLAFFESVGIEAPPIIGVGYEESRNGAKAAILEAVGARIYFDDDIKMIRAILSAGEPSCKLCLFDPEGRENVPLGVLRTSSWCGIVMATRLVE